jgi:phosphocarrier protein FPr
MWTMQQLVVTPWTATPRDEPDVEWQRLREAVAVVRRDIELMGERTAREVGNASAAIFEAHLLLLDDSFLLDDVRARIENGKSAASAWAESVDGVEGEFLALEDLS